MKVPDQKDDEGKKLFFTTSDLMNSMNHVLQTTADPTDPLQPKFELQRRLPDGSTRLADAREVAAADMESKFQQAAKLVEMLTPTQRLEWAKQQRQAGNALYRKGDYRAAMDVYLTCLVARPSEKSDDASTTANQREFMSLVFLPVMNNLAQCALQLGMFRKGEQFVTMALDEMSRVAEPHCIQYDPDLLSKLHFRRAKARRMQGSYDGALDDVQRARSFLARPDSSERRAIDRELRVLQKTRLEAERNRKRHERAMKKALGGNVFSGEAASKVDMEKRDTCSEPTSPLRAKHRIGRKYSTLRARNKENEIQSVDREAWQASYWQWYLGLVGRVTEKLVVWIGDGKKDSRETRGNDRREKVN